MWSPAPWLKLSSGNSISGQSGNLPVNGTPWPFIWGGNFAGGKLDEKGAQGGPAYVATQLFYVTINDVLGADTSGVQFDPDLNIDFKPD